MESEQFGLVPNPFAPTARSCSIPMSTDDEAPAVEPPEPLSIRLDDFLKFCGVVGTGGQAKILIQAGDVRVNGEVETRRRKQLFPGDVVDLLGEQIEVEGHP